MVVVWYTAHGIVKIPLFFGQTLGYRQQLASYVLPLFLCRVTGMALEDCHRNTADFTVHDPNKLVLMILASPRLPYAQGA